LEEYPTSYRRFAGSFLFKLRDCVLKGAFDFVPNFFRTCFDVFPCLITGSLQLVQLSPCLILSVLQGIDVFVVFDFCLGLDLAGLCLEQGDLCIPFIQLSIELFYLCFSFFLHGNLRYLILSLRTTMIIRNDTGFSFPA